MGTITSSSTLFEPALVANMFEAVKGHSALAKLCASTAIPFAGVDTFIFTMDGEAAIVGEGEAKPAGAAAITPVTIKPIKFVYQHRLTDEFVNMAAEKQVPYLQEFTNGFAKKIARALDIAAIHGLNPATATAADAISAKSIDAKVTATVTYAAGAPDDCIDAAAGKVQTAGGTITGVVMSTTAGADIGKLKTGSEHIAMYPEYRFGGNPAAFGGIPSDVNSTVEFGASKDRIIVGDFANAFKWGYAANVPTEIIQYGDPDGLGDLKKTNQIVLRAEAYIGWGILDPTAFCRVVAE